MIQTDEEKGRKGEEGIDRKDEKEENIRMNGNMKNEISNDKLDFSSLS